MRGREPGFDGGQPAGGADGASGKGMNRDVYFRPTRFRPEDFRPLEVVTRLRPHGGAVYELPLRNISEAGAAVEWPSALPLRKGETWSVFEVFVDGWRAWAGTIRVESVRTAEDVSVAGVSFTDGLVDIAEAMRLREVASWTSAELSSPAAEALEVPESDRFRSLVSELKLYLDDAQRWYAALEARLPWEVVHGDPKAAAHQALRRRVMEEFVSGFVRRSDRVNDAWLMIPEARRLDVAPFSRRLLHDHFLSSPLMRRALEKPLGYPGDYEVMGYMYENHFAGVSLFAKALTLAILWTRSCQAVRTRKDAVRARLEERIASATGPLRVLSVAAGPAQEIYEILSTAERVPVPVEVVLFDQDPAALGRAYTRLRDLVRRKPHLDVEIVYLKEDIVTPKVDVLTSGGLYDFIFSCGLFDYFRHLVAVSRAEALARCLRSGGELYIGNMVPESPARWMMELHLEWSLCYRTREQMRAIGARAAPFATIATVEEASGVNPFLVIRRE